MTSETNGANGANGAEQHYLLYIWAGVEPEVHGPYATDEERLEAARAIDTDEHGIFRLDATGPVEVSSFGARETAGRAY